MKKYTTFPEKNFLARLLVIVSLIGFNSAFAESNNVSTSQVAQLEKVARATKTSISVVRVTTTVKVYGNNKKTNKKVIKSVMKIMSQKNKTTWEKSETEKKVRGHKSKTTSKYKKQKTVAKKTSHKIKPFPSLAK